MRVVSLLPAATEILCALGVDPVGVSHECDYPPRVADLPTVVHPTIDTTGTSGAIDAQVQEATADGVYDLDTERLRDLDPDVVVTQGICDVCAVDESVVRGAVADLGLDVELVASHPHTLGDVFDDVERLGRVLEREDRAVDLVRELRGRVDAVRERVADVDTRPTATVLDWLDPLMVAGHWVPELVERAGGEFVLGDAGAHSGPVEWPALRDADPDVVVAAPCGFSLDQTVQNLDELTGREGWAALTAVREGRSYAVDGNHHVNRPGPRLVETLEQFAVILHPEQFGDPSRDVVRRVGELAGST
jgi:iron complex transport system substrate-binding protein